MLKNLQRKKHEKKLFLTAVLFFIFLPGTITSQTLTSENYTIESSVLSGGGVSSTSANYILTETLSEPFATSTQSSNYQALGGFWYASQGRLSASVSSATINLGDFSRNSVSTASQTFTVTSTVVTGYSIQMTEDGNLRSGGNDVDDVSDGAVSAGSEEYGISTSGTDGQYNATDTAITDAYKTISTRSSTADGVQTTVTYKASVSAGTEEGTYSHSVTFYVTANL